MHCDLLAFPPRTALNRFNLAGLSLCTIAISFVPLGTKILSPVMFLSINFSESQVTIAYPTIPLLFPWALW